MSTTPSSLNPQKPPSGGYDPTNPTPYTPPQLPEPQAAPVPQIAQPQQQQQQQYGTKAGSIAQIGDSILRGFMTGKADSEAKKAMKLKRQSDNMQAAYNAAAQNLKGLHDSGVDPKSDQYKQAKAAVDGSWAGLMQFYGQHVAPQDNGKKKSKAKQVEGGILGKLQSKDPMEVSGAWYQVMQKAGPPVYYQLGDPKAIQQRKQAQANAGETESITTGLDLETVKLQAIPGENRTPEQRKRLTELTTKPVTPKDPTNALELGHQAFVREKGHEPNFQEAVDIANKTRPEGKEPSSPFAAAAMAQERELGRPLTKQEVLDTYKATKGADEFAQVRSELAQMRFDEVKQKQLDVLQKSATTEADKHKKEIQSRIDKLDKTKPPEGSTVGWDDYNKSLSKIESDDYAGMVRIGQDLQRSLAQHGVDIDVPLPRAWENPVLPKDEREKIFGSAKKTPVSQNPSASNKPEELPDEAKAQLQKGHVTTFGNGSRWHLDANGKPEMLSPPQGQ